MHVWTSIVFLFVVIQYHYVDWLIRHIPLLILTLSSVNIFAHIWVAMDLGLLPLTNSITLVFVSSKKSPS